MNYLLLLTCYMADTVTGTQGDLYFLFTKCRRQLLTQKCHFWRIFAIDWLFRVNYTILRDFLRTR